MHTLRLLLLTAACCVLVSGCRVSEHQDANHDNVEIGTPFGSMHVKTNTSGPVADVGIAAYPGAVPYKSDGKSDDSADVDMSFGGFHLGVRVASYKTADNQDKILSFYRKDLARYGEVLECRDNKPVGQPTHTSQGLTCSDHNGHAHADDSGLELRAGSPEHQHIVAIESKDGGNKIALVALDLPEHHDSSDSE